MWTDEMKADMASASIEKACQWTDGAYYEYPLCMTCLLYTSFYLFSRLGPPAGPLSLI